MGKKSGSYESLKKIEDDLNRFKPILENMGRNIERAFKGLKEDFYETTLTIGGSIIEDILKNTWKKEKIRGNPAKKTIEQLLQVIRNKIEIDKQVDDYFSDIQRVRNRGLHGGKVSFEDCLEFLRKLETVLDWYCKKYVGYHISQKEDESAQVTPIDKAIQNDGLEVENKPPKSTPQVEDKGTATIKIELLRLIKAFKSLQEKSKNIKLPNKAKDIQEKAQDQVQKFFKKGRNIVQGIIEKLEKGTRE